MEEDKNLEQNLDKSNEKLHISDVIGSVDSKIFKIKLHIFATVMCNKKLKNFKILTPTLTSQSLL